MTQGRAPRFGAAIAKVRRSAGISQRELARRLDKTQALVSYWEGGSARISTETFAEVAYQFGLRPFELMQIAEELAEGVPTP